ncbi:metallopeptidase TldD-related protein [Haladaptatus sp. YSMS36]|uniref:metallopeptidase TldD-related protein n=1 Tax=Haladaptatus sp. YSMS36 TaxID=3033384 RepID=UPI0023E8F905|nr:metallopeptidase TldD-related protein [Haladaptatus sp. YSMS36]
MDADREALVDALEFLLDRFEGVETVAYAEVGAIAQAKTDIVVTEDGLRNATPFTETGVCCRVFAEGAADYRYTTSLDEESLTDVSDRAIRSGEVLAQRDAGRFDQFTHHQGVHGGWASSRIDAVEKAEKVDILQAGLTAGENLDLSNAWVNYTDAHIETTLATTTGSTVQTTLDRGAVTAILTLIDGQKVKRHAGSTRGVGFLDHLPGFFDELVEDATELESATVETPPTGETTIVLSPRAAGQLFHFVSRYLEADMGYMGLSPYAVGDRIGSNELAIEDTIHAGSWAALAYDFEGRPTTPVQLVEDGRVTRLLHNTTSAAEEDTFPAGSAVPSLGFDQPPRIHARHLEVAPGTATTDELNHGATVVIDRFGDPYLRDDLERVQRTGVMPPSVLYAKDIDRKTTDRPDRGRAQLPVAEGYRLDGGERVGRVSGVALDFEPGTLDAISAIGRVRETTTGVANKHKSRLPYAVTAPGIRLHARLESL